MLGKKSTGEADWARVDKLVKTSGSRHSMKDGDLHLGSASCNGVKVTHSNNICCGPTQSAGGIARAQDGYSVIPGPVKRVKT